MKYLITFLFILVLSSCYVQSEYPYRDEPPARPRADFRIYWYPYPSYPYWSRPYYWVPPPPRPYIYPHPHPQPRPRHNGPRRR